MPLPDVIAKNLTVLFCGMNPGLKAASSGHHFEGRGNRFWRALHGAGFTPKQLEPARSDDVLQYGIGLTTVVARPTAAASEVSRAEFQRAGRAFRKKLITWRPRVVAFLGKAAFAAITDQRDVAWGEQPALFEDVGAWVLPNPSGRNLAFSVDALISHYRKLSESIVR